MAAILRENEQMPWTELSGASFVFAFLDSRLCKQIGKNADVLFVCGYIMGLTLRCRRYIFLAGSLHLKLVHRFPSLGNVDLIVALHTVFSPFCFLAVLFRNHSFANIFLSISVNFRKEIQKMTDFIDTPFRFCTDFPARLHSIGICDIVRQNG